MSFCPAQYLEQHIQTPTIRAQIILRKRESGERHGTAKLPDPAVLKTSTVEE
jgi:hypothetical protein